MPRHLLQNYYLCFLMLIFCYENKNSRGDYRMWKPHTEAHSRLSSASCRHMEKGGPTGEFPELSRRHGQASSPTKALTRSKDPSRGYLGFPYRKLNDGFRYIPSVSGHLEFSGCPVATHALGGQPWPQLGGPRKSVPLCVPRPANYRELPSALNSGMVL